MFKDIWNRTFQQLAGLPISANRTTCLKDSMEWDSMELQVASEVEWNGSGSVMEWKSFRIAWNGTVNELEVPLFQDSMEWNSSWIRRTSCFRNIEWNTS